jgi:phosphoribosylamine---glycine ligase
LKILVVGGGGREHALVWRLAQAPGVHTVYAAPGNPGMAQNAECITLAEQTPAAWLAAAERLSVDLTVVGPEVPLVAGIVDHFQQAGRQIVGPSQSAAQLEGSKTWSKDFMARHGIPTARFAATTSLEEAKTALRRFSYPVVLKADGLAAGKGVVIAKTAQQAHETLEAMYSGSLVGAAGHRVIIEDFWRGEEVSFIALCDGERALPLETSQDHKAAYDGDEGPNTGGMGAYCDTRLLSTAQRSAVMEQVIEPTLAGMKREGNPFRGFLYAGLMLTDDGIKVLEFNARLGDPETQVLLHRIDGGLVEALAASARGDLRGCQLQWHSGPSVCVVMAAEYYPAEPTRGDTITGIAEAEATGAKVFHAGTRQNGDQLQTNGGRVLGVTARGTTLSDAISGAYRAVSNIQFRGMHFRRDIGAKGLGRWQ